MAVEGTLELFKLPEILQLIAQQKKTGILTVQGQQDIIAVTFLNGQIVAADALNQTVEEGLAQVLVGERLLSAADFTQATAEHESAGGRLLDLLVDHGYIARSDLLRGLRLQTVRLLEQLLRWDKGDFKFYSGDEVPFEEGFVPLSVEELLFQAAESATAPVGARPVPVPISQQTPQAPQPSQPISPISQTPPLRRTAPAPAPEEVPSPSQIRPALRVVRREGELPETSGPFRKMKVETPVVAPSPLLPKLLALGLVLMVAAVLLFRSEALILPFPWQTRERADLAQDQRASLYLKIDRAAKTYFLLEGHFPANLAQLEKEGLLSGGDLSDPQGHPFRYTVTEESYALEPLQGDKPIPGAETSEAVTGNFFLDPEFLTVPSESTAPPLVLLD